MLRLTAFSVVSAALLALPSPAQVVGRHVLEIDAPQSAFTYSGSVTFSGLGGQIVGNPPNFNVSGAASADLGITAGSVVNAALVAGNNTVVTVPTLNAIVPNILPFLPPLATIQVTGTTVVFRSVDVATGAPQVFAVQPNGAFATGVVGDVLSGTATITGIVNLTVPMAGITTTATAVTGTLTSTPTGVQLRVAINTTLNFADPATGASGTLTLVGTIVANDRALAADIDQISSAAGGTQVLRLSAGTGAANATYLVLGTVTGTSPGLTFGSVNLPINFDAITDFGISNPNSFPYTNSFGTLDGGGFGTAAFTLPTFQPALVLPFHHAYALIAPGGVVTFASNAVPLALTN